MKRYHGIYNIHTYLHVFFSKITMRNLILKIAISTFTTLVGSCFSIILINDIRHRAYGAGGARGVPWHPHAPPPVNYLNLGGRFWPSHNYVLAPTGFLDLPAALGRTALSYHLYII